ncbi:MAG: adenylosuccinate lyase [Clostridia bacterium]|nr:adenylosuccinate lyase [Clostridia bacterium]
MTDKYESPLSTRYASAYMLNLFSSDTRYKTWRKLWVALARAEMKLGLPITQQQVDELETHLDDIDYDVVAKREKEVRHDVMAHVYAYGLKAPSAAGIIHLGATSCYVTDNADLVIYRDGLRYLRHELLSVIANLADFAMKYRAMPTLGYTHYQPAQLVTVGKRASLWMQDLISDVKELDFAIENIKFLGCRGTTGTEASFLDLFEGSEEKIDRMNRMIAGEFEFDEIFDVCGQTYPRKLDSRILNALSSIAQSCYRMANDIRLLQHDRQVEEPFEKNQIGSSAMAYKRNPMRSERICSLSRYLMADAMNAPMTASVQWLERTLDDSANRRISLPEGFLCADAILRLAMNITDGLNVNAKIIERTVREYLPFIATENLMMEAVKRGGDRQQLHEIIRKCSMEATARMKEGESCDLLERLAKEKEFGLSLAEMEKLLEPTLYIGRCPDQVERLVEKVRPLIAEAAPEKAEINL